MKTFKDFLMESLAILENDSQSISLYHHPSHGYHHSEGSHNSIRSKVGSDYDTERDEHTAVADIHKGNATVYHYSKKNHKPDHNTNFDNILKSKYKIKTPITHRHLGVDESETLEEAKKSLAPVDGHQPVVSLLHHPSHGIVHKDGYGGHDQIRKKLKYGKDDTEFEHTAHAHMDKSGKTLMIGHHGVPKKPGLMSDYEAKVKKHYSLPKNHAVKHYNIHNNKGI